MITVYLPNNCHAERAYAASVILELFLGLPAKLKFMEDQDHVALTFDGSIFIRLPDCFFSPGSKWLSETTIPESPLRVEDFRDRFPEARLTAPQLPILYGDVDTKYDLEVDVFGSAFFMLTRFEEFVSNQRDDRDRFLASYSIASRENFLNRPIVNEYADLLFCVLKRAFPKIERPPRKFRILPSHDVDSPFMLRDRSPYQLLRKIAGDILLRRSLSSALNQPAAWVAAKKNPQMDPYFNFGEIMDISERQGLKSAFYFIPGWSNCAEDPTYHISDPSIVALIRDISDRGHEVGFHGSYETYLSLEKTKAEYSELKELCEFMGVNQSAFGGRQHYLRWSNPETIRNWERVGLNYDSTLGFADSAGFRCGTCFEYPFFDLEESREMQIMERPLIVMDCSLTSPEYMNLSKDCAIDYALELKSKCRLFEGDFSLLWHNSSLHEPGEMEIYLTLIRLHN